jgi:hypothetical protein
MVQAVVMVKERAQRFVDVARSWVSRQDSGQHVGVVLIIEAGVTGRCSIEEIAGKTIAFRGRVSVVNGSRQKEYQTLHCSLEAD